jgi:uncharacterized protein DUF4129
MTERDMGVVVGWVRRWTPLAAIAVLLGAAMFAALYADPVLSTAPNDVPSSGPGLQSAPAPASADTLITTAPAEQHAGEVPLWITNVLLGICLAAVLFVVGLMVWMALRYRIGLRRPVQQLVGGAVPTLEETRTSVRDVLNASLADLDDADVDPRRAIIACWVGLERAATTAGVERSPADTSTDLVTRLLARHLVVRADVLDELAALYRQARYGPHEIDVGMRERARAALVELRRELVSGQVRHPVRTEP